MREGEPLCNQQLQSASEAIVFVAAIFLRFFFFAPIVQYRFKSDEREVSSFHAPVYLDM